MNYDNLVNYYNKFNEDKRLTHRHGIVEYTTAMKYIHEYVGKESKILDVGAGCGAYSIPLSEEGHDVCAIELIKHNLMALKGKNSAVKAYLGSAIDLSMFSDKSFDIALLFGPMYHLIKKEDKIKALIEAKRVLKDTGYIFVSYYMNDYAIINHGFIENTILDDIDELNSIVDLKRVKILAQDGPSDYIRSTLNKMDDKTFDTYIKYHLSICERKEMLGASSHVLDILKK